MSATIIIGSNVITIPTSGTDANWAEGFVEFAKAVEYQLQYVGPPNDVPPQVLPIPLAAPLELTNANFPSAAVRSFSFSYSIYKVRINLTPPNDTFIETGIVTGVNNNGVWTLQREFHGDRKSDGTSYHDFYMVANQIWVASSAVPGTGTYDTVNSKITYAAVTLPVNN